MFLTFKTTHFNTFFFIFFNHFILLLVSPNSAKMARKREAVFFQKRRRSRYTQLEERKMWHFFLRELKAQNPDALRKRQVLWELYEQDEMTTKRMFGLESHFRKYMLPRINRAAVPREDLFLLFRFFRAHLNTSQREELEEIHDCEIECEMDGTFLRARVEFLTGEVFYPTAEQEATILRSLDDDSATELQTEADTVSVVADSVFDEENEGGENRPSRQRACGAILERRVANHNRNDANDENTATNCRSGWISKSALLTRLPPPRPPKKQLNNRNAINKVLMLGDDSPFVHSTPLQTGKDPDESGGHRRSSTLPQLVGLELSPIQPEVLISHQPTSHAAAKMNTVHQSASAKLKCHFLDASLKVLAGRMELETFVRPFLGSKFEKGSRAIYWLMDHQQQQRRAHPFSG